MSALPSKADIASQRSKCQLWANRFLMALQQMLPLKVQYYSGASAWTLCGGAISLKNNPGK
jgi:hypothetical protein